VIFYDADEAVLTVLRILHDSMDIAQHLPKG
jgi:plasmid stabilization system protein ParE